MMNATIPAVFDMDIGNDPDDTYVALMVLCAPSRFAPALLLTNDETKSFGRARFMATLMALGPRDLSDVPIAAGLPSLRRRKRCLVEDAGLTRNDLDFERDGVKALERTIEAHERIRYYGLGALSNLDAVLSSRPDLASRVELVQMGPALRGAFRRDVPQYNARLDPVAFVRVMQRVCQPLLVFSHSTWGTYATSGRQSLGVYPDDPFASALRQASAASALYVRHLESWTKTGKECSILHDPTTVLGRVERDLIDVADVGLLFDEEGWATLDRASHEALRALLPERAQVIADYLKAPPRCVEGTFVRCSMSLDVDHRAMRRAIACAVLGEEGTSVAGEWEAFHAA